MKSLFILLGPIENPKTIRRKAEQYCKKLLALSPSVRQYTTFGDYAEQYFKDDDSPWWTRKIGSGKKIISFTREQHRARLETHILPQFSNHRFSELSPVAIENWIFNLDYSNHWKRHIYNTFKIILFDLRRENLISFSSSDIEPPVARNESEKEILSDDMALKIFPENIEEFKELWGKGYNLGVFLALLYSTGLRTSEARALVWEAVNWQYNGIKVIQTVNKDGDFWIPKGKSIRVIPVR